MNKKKISIVLNSILVIFCIIGIFLALKENINIIEFYTEDSNILAGISSLLFVIYSLKKKEIPLWLVILRYVAVCCLTVTFIVVVTILIPTSNINYFEGIKHFLLNGSMLFHHFLCPVISFISFVLFEKDERLNKKKYLYLPLIPTLIYGLILITLNILSIVVGPYPFLMVYYQPWYMTIIWIIIIGVGNYFIAYLTLFLNQLGITNTKRL